MEGDLLPVMDEERRAADQFVPGVAEMTAGGTVDVEDQPRHVGGDDQVVDGFEDAVLEFAEVEGDLGLLRVGPALLPTPEVAFGAGHDTPPTCEPAPAENLGTLPFWRTMGDSLVGI